MSEETKTVPEYSVDELRRRVARRAEQLKAGKVMDAIEKTDSVRDVHDAIHDGGGIQYVESQNNPVVGNMWVDVDARRQFVCIEVTDEVGSWVEVAFPVAGSGLQ